MFDLMIIFTFQSMYGYVFSWIGILVAAFMAGAACGALLITTVLGRIKNHLKAFRLIELALICFCIAVPLLFLALPANPDNPGVFFLFKALFLTLSFTSGFLTGSQFPLANKLYLKKSTNLSETAGLLYGADLLGGWLGGIVGAVVLLPVLGLTGTCITVGLLKLTSLTVISTQKDRHL